MPVTRATLLKFAPWIAVAAGFVGGMLTMSPIAAQTRAQTPPIQLVQPSSLVRAAPTSQAPSLQW